MKIILIGAPGCGKGTQASYICSKYNLPHISISQLIRDCLKSNNQSALEVQKLLNEGKLISDELVIKLLIQRLNAQDCKNGYLLDGFPRTIAQAVAFESIDTVDIVVYINTSIETISNRIQSRMICEKCGMVYSSKELTDLTCKKCGGKIIKRKDDNLSIFTKRLEIYNKETYPVVNYYKTQLKLVEVENNGSAEETFVDIQNILDNLG